MTETQWTWLLFVMEVIGVAGMIVVGRKLWWGWLVVLLHSIPWFMYSLAYGKPGFIAMSGMWWLVNATNMVRWWREARN